MILNEGILMGITRRINDLRTAIFRKLIQMSKGGEGKSLYHLDPISFSLLHTHAVGSPVLGIYPHDLI